MTTQRTITLNDYGLARRERTSASGNTSTRYTISIDAKPLTLAFDAKVIGAGVADAIAQHLKKRVSTISAVASPSTQLARKYAHTAFSSGKPWALKQYSGGRLGPFMPNQSSRLFNDSGRFRESIVVGATKEDNWVINIAANRLNPSFLKGGEAGVIEMYRRLRVHVPEFGLASALVEVPAIRLAIGEALDALFIAERGKSYQRNARLRQSVRELIKTSLQELGKPQQGNQ